MKQTLLSTLVVAFVVGLAVAPTVAARGDGGKEGMSTVARAGTAEYMVGSSAMTSQQRGDFARDFVKKWGPYYASTYKQPVSAWAQKEAQIIGTADPQNLRSAMGKTTLEAAMMTMRGHQVSDDDAIDFLAQQPAQRAGQLPTAIGDLAKDLVYTPVTPCRIFDTRVVGGPVASGATRDFDTYPWGTRTGFEQQGGKANTNCGMISKAAAVAINIAAPLPEVGGYLTAYPYMTTRPLASNLDYKAGELKNNEVVVKIGQGSYDIGVYAHGKTHLVGDVVGYYAAPEATAFSCLNVSDTNSIAINQTGSVSMTCPSGYTASGGGAYWASGSKGDVENWPDSSMSAWWGWGRNSGTSAQTLNGVARCCRVPGR